MTPGTRMIASSAVPPLCGALTITKALNRYMSQVQEERQKCKYYEG